MYLYSLRSVKRLEIKACASSIPVSVHGVYMSQYIFNTYFLRMLCSYLYGRAMPALIPAFYIPEL